MFIPSCLQLVCIESSLILNPHRLLSGKWSGNVLSAFIWLKVLFSFIFLQRTEHCWTGFALKTTSGFKLNATLRPLLSFFYSIFPFSLAQHATCCCFSPHVWGSGKRKRGQIPPRRVGGGGGKIKHRMMGAVIASQTTERIKNPLPSLACFIASSSSLDGIITLFVLRKRKLAAAIQTTVRPRGSIAPPDMDVLWHSDRDLQSYQEGGDLKQRRTRFLPCPSSFRLWSWRVWRLEGGRCATAACYYHPRIKILFSYIYHKHFIAQLLSLPLGCICHRSDRTKRRPSFLPPHGLQALHGFFFLFPSLLIFRMDL